ncbi:MAG TPA: hypothetical protein VHR42_07355 [Clostridia bacterium]|nr:hypothetical protein [Clostridia bacterium]
MSVIVSAVFDSEDLADLAAARVKREVSGIESISIVENRYANEHQPSQSYIITGGQYTNYYRSYAPVPVFPLDDDSSINYYEPAERQDALLRMEVDNGGSKIISSMLRNMGGRQIRQIKK